MHNSISSKIINNNNNTFKVTKSPAQLQTLNKRTNKVEQHKPKTAPSVAQLTTMPTTKL